MNRMNRGWFMLSFIVGLAAAAANLWGWQFLPEQVPIHWNISGEVDRYGSRNWQVVVGFLPLAVCLLMAWVPRIDPKKEAYRKHARAYGILALLIITSMSMLSGLPLLAAMGKPVNIPQTMAWMLGILLLVMGNYMGQIRPNWFVGIVTPWTLASEDTWRKTHRFGGVVTMIMGLLVFLSGFLKPEWSFVLVMAAVVGGSLLPVVYSYLDYRKRTHS